MFDIAFSELLIICVVALVVIGPEKMPRIARTAGHLFGKAQRYINDVKTELNAELKAEGLQSLQDEIRQHMRETESATYQVGQVIRHEIPHTGPKYQVGQVIRHDMEEPDATAHHPSAVASTSADERLPLKQDMIK